MQKAIKRYFPVFVLPTLIAFTIGFLAPFVLGVYLSFCKFTTVTDAKFIGLSNYAKIPGDGDFLHSLWFIYNCDSIIDQHFCICGSNAFDKEYQGNQYFPYCIFYAEPDRWYCTWICMAAVIKWYSGTFPENTYIFFKIWFLGIGYPDALAAGWIHDDHLHLRNPEYSWRADRGSTD